MPREIPLQTKCLEWATEQGLFARKVTTPGRRGFPDTLILLPGNRIVFCELKTPKGTGRLSGAQIRTIKKMREYQADVFVTNNFETFKREILERLGAGTT